MQRPNSCFIHIVCTKTVVFKCLKTSLIWQLTWNDKVWCRCVGWGIIWFFVRLSTSKTLLFHAYFYVLRKYGSLLPVIKHNATLETMGIKNLCKYNDHMLLRLFEKITWAKQFYLNDIFLVLYFKFLIWKNRENLNRIQYSLNHEQYHSGNVNEMKLSVSPLALLNRWCRYSWV